MQSDFSIIIPTFNSEAFLKQTLESIKKQDLSIKIQCIFSDGGSSDKTIEIIESFNQTNISKIILLDQIGLSKALNSGFYYANGKYVTYLNSDDLLATGALINIKKNFEKFDKYDWVVGYCENFGNKNILNKIINIYKKYLILIISFNLLCINNVISQPSVYWKKTFFQKVGYFNENLNYNMDYDMWLRMIKISKPLKLENTISYFRRHNQSLSHKNLLNQLKEKYKTMKKYNKNPLISSIHLLLSLLIVIIYKVTNY